MQEAFPEYGIVENSGEWTGLTSERSAPADGREGRGEGFGKAAITYRLRDWGISRQRYWGTPIPMIHCAKCGVVPVPENQTARRSAARCQDHRQGPFAAGEASPSS